MTATFKQWVEASFDHPPPKTLKDDWFRDEGFDSSWELLGIDDAVALKYLTRLFLESEHLTPHTLEQVAEGIWFLIGDSSPSKSTEALLNPAISLDARVACIYAMTEFFRSFVAPATPGLADTDSDPFHGACYMWWDILSLRPFRGDSLRGEPELHDACVDTMAEILGLHSDVCRIAALHGLNHWQEHFPRQVEAAIDTFLGANPALTPRILEYANKARYGLCL